MNVRALWYHYTFRGQIGLFKYLMHQNLFGAFDVTYNLFSMHSESKFPYSSILKSLYIVFLYVLLPVLFRFDNRIDPDQDPIYKSFAYPDPDTKRIQPISKE